MVHVLRGPSLAVMDHPFQDADLRKLAVGAVAGLVLAAGFAFGSNAFGSTPPHPDTWLSEEEQEVLVESMSDFDGWVAGCLLDGIDEAPVSPPRGERADYEGELESGRRIRLVNVSDAPRSHSYDELLGNGYFCYIPE